jgi:uncharacterized protein YegL
MLETVIRDTGGAFKEKLRADTGVITLGGPMSSMSDISFADNPDPRCPVVLVLDTSGSMGERSASGQVPITELNEGLKVLAGELLGDQLAARRVEIAVVGCGLEVELLNDFTVAQDWSPPFLEPVGATPLGEALGMALDILETRKQTYRANGVSYYRPWVMLITDGVPTDDVTGVAARIKAAEDSKSLAFFAVGIEGADIGMLSTISVRDPLMMSGMKFNELFVWLSASQARVSSSRPGESVDLPSPVGWAAV